MPLVTNRNRASHPSPQMSLNPGVASDVAYVVLNKAARVRDVWSKNS